MTVDHAFGKDRKDRILRERGLLPPIEGEGGHTGEPTGEPAGIVQGGGPALRINCVRMTTKVFEQMRDAEAPPGYVHGGAIGALFSIPVIIDDELPAEPGFEVRHVED